MGLEKIKAYLSLIRIDHAVMASFGAFLGLLLLNCQIRFSTKEIVFLLIPAIVEIALFSLNDYIDYEIDKKNKRSDRPLTKGLIKRKHALLLSIVAFVLAFFLSFLVLNEKALAIVIGYSFLGVVYNLWLKRIALVGNSVVAIGMGAPFIYANYFCFNSLKPISLILFGMAFTIGLAREIIKDIEDYKGERNFLTLPNILGVENSAKFAGVVLLFFMIIAVLPFLFLLKPTFFSTLSLIGSYALIGYSSGLAFFQIKGKQAREKARKAKKLLFLGIAFGLLALFLTTI